MPRLLFAECIGEKRSSVRYVMREEKGKVWKGSEITKEFAKKWLNVSNL